MRTLQVTISDEIFGVLSSLAKLQDEFVVEAIREKLEREKKQKQKTNSAEEYKTQSKESLRPFGLSKGNFIVPKDFDMPLPDEVLEDFEN